ncbi:hypothetical protein LCGC14_2304280 [marine sediment metagenome]|uniref:Uncharacterized protein n=1 Tax=marine sediment metagenome TaxID=412755 RepID=A0A0F9FHG6_9ZZZZ
MGWTEMSETVRERLERAREIVGLGKVTITNADEVFALIGLALIQLGAMERDREAMEQLVNRQAEDEGLWARPIPPALQSITEAMLQAALRELHEMIEGITGEEVARAILGSPKQSSEPSKLANNHTKRVFIRRE